MRSTDASAAPASRAPSVAGVPDWLAAVALAWIAGWLLFVAARPLATDDLWWHLAMGEVYAGQGLWPQADPLVHTTAFRPPVQHEWLFQVVVYQLSRGLGLQGLRVVHAGALLGILALAFATLRRAAGGALLPAAAATAVFAMLAWYRLIQFRPDLLSIPLTLVLYRWLLEREAPSRAALLAGAALLWLWSNAHSVFAVGLALLLAGLVGAALEAAVAARLGGEPVGGARARRLAGALVLGGLVSLANPRGVLQHVTFFQFSRESAMWSIEDDWQPFHPLAPLADNPALPALAWALADALLVALLLVSGAALLGFARERSREALERLDLVHLALAAAGVVAMLVTIRFHWLSILPLLYLARRRRFRGAAARGRAPAVRLALAGAVLALAAAFPSASGLPAFAREAAVERGGYLGSAILDRRFCGPGSRFLADARLEGNLFHPYHLGGYLAWRHAPRLRTFIDGRMDHYPRDVFEDYRAIVRAAETGPAQALRVSLDRREVDVYFRVHFPEGSYGELSSGPWIRFLPEWVRVFQSDTHAVYLRQGERNELNFFRVIAYYRERGLPFDPVRGLDVSAIARSDPLPDWAFEQQLLPADYAGLRRARAGPDPETRLVALRALGEHLARIGAHTEQVEIDAELVALRPGEREPRRRLADGLLALRRYREALGVARELRELAPGYRDADLLYELADRLSERGRRSARRREGRQVVAPR